MTDSNPPQSSKALVGALAACLIIVAVVAGYFIVKSNQQIAALQAQSTASQAESANLTTKLAATQQQVASLTSQLEDSEKQVAKLQPLADKARTLPIVYRIDHHDVAAGYALLISNRSRESLRFKFVVNGARTTNAVIDGSKGWLLRGLATGDTVVVSSQGYDPKTIPIQ